MGVRKKLVAANDSVAATVVTSKIVHWAALRGQPDGCGDKNGQDVGQDFDRCGTRGFGSHPASFVVWAFRGVGTLLRIV